MKTRVVTITTRQAGQHFPKREWLSREIPVDRIEETEFL